jgi:signal transduction histidine kinase/ligand-binding sensor domain-containing protein
MEYKRKSMSAFQRRRLRAASLLLCLAAAAYAQNSLDPSRIPFSSISTEEGLSNDSVYCLLQDSRGFVWVGTFGGLDRYDGKETVSFKPGGSAGFSLSASVVFALAEGAGGVVWAGTDGGGLNRIDPESGEVSAFRGNAAAEAGPGSDLVYALAAEADGDLWIGTGGRGLAFRDERTGAFSHLSSASGKLPADVVRALLLDRSGRLWAGTAGGGLVSSGGPASPDSAFVPVSLPGAPETATVRSLHEDARGRIWIGTEGYGLYAADPGAAGARRVPLPAASGGERAIVRAVASDAAGRVWVGTEGEGVAVLDPAGTWSAALRFDELAPAGIAGDQVRTILRDLSGLMWIGLKDQGISIANPAAPAFGLRRAGSGGQLPRGTVRGFVEGRDGTLYLASDGGGLVAYDLRAETYRAYGEAEGLASRRVCSVLESRGGAVYAGTDGSGLFRLDKAAGRFVPVSLGLEADLGSGADGGAVVWALLEDSRGSLWAGLEGAGLVELRSDGSRARYAYDPLSSSGLGGRSVRCLLENSDGSILVGTWDGGLQRLDPRTGTVSRYPTSGDGPSATSDVSIYCLVRDSAGRVWIGTGSGLDLLEGSSGGGRIARSSLGPLPRRPGIFGIAEDGAGRLWLSTEQGLLRYDPRTSALRGWTRADGLQDDHFYPGSFLKLADGRLAFGGSAGFNLFSPDAVSAGSTPPPVRIVSLLPLDGQGAPERSAAIPADGSVLRVPYATSGFSLKLAVLDFTDPDKNLHAVRVEGPRGQRYFLGTSASAIVPRLSPGRYRFIASGAGNRGVWNEEGSSVIVEVVPPFWSAPLFLVLAGLGAAGVVFAAFRLRVSALERRTRELRDLSAHVHEAREAERTEIAREVHDELGQTLTALKMGIYWAKDNARISAESMEHRLGELLEYTDLALDSVKSISTRLRPKALDTLPLGEALDWLVRDFRRWSGVECKTDFDPTPFPVDSRTKTTLFRVLQEILTNVARHSGARSVSIALSVGETQFELRVRDDGHGVDPAAADSERSFGIAGMKERCAYLGGSFEIAPAGGGGTVVIAVVPRASGPEDTDA